MKAYTIFRRIVNFLILILLFSFCFSVSAQTTWYKYPGNPVFHSGADGEWDSWLASAVVRFYNGKYHMWYVGFDKKVTGYGSVGYATSDDCIHWEKYKDNPLKFTCEGSPWDHCIRGIDVLIIDSMYHMWYSGLRRDKLFDSYIGYAWSKDGISWTKRSEPVLKPGQEKAWDHGNVVAPSVIFIDNEYHMWYLGTAFTIPLSGKTGYARSNDGIHWEKYPDNPVLDKGKPGSFDDYWAYVGSVLFNGTSFEMWYTGLNWVQHEIGYAKSDDGTNWIKYSGNPVLRYGELGSWDDWFVIAEEVILRDSVYKMIFKGDDRYSGREYGFATTSAEEARAWELSEMEITHRKIRVHVLNSVEFINEDSLLYILPNLSGKELIDAFNKLALVYSLKDKEKSFDYAEKALESSLEINYPAGKAMAFYSMGNCQYVMDNYTDALINQLSALRLFDSLGMFYESGSLLSQIASIYAYSGSFELESKYLLQSVEVFESLKDTITIIQTLNKLGTAFLNAGDTLKAISSFHKGLHLSTLKREIELTNSFYEALGCGYRGMLLDSSIYYFSKALQYWDTSNWIKIGFVNMNMAEAYHQAGPTYYDEAKKHYLSAYEIYKQNGREKTIRFFHGFAELYFNMGEYNKAREFISYSLLKCFAYRKKLNHQMYISLNEKKENEIFIKKYIEKGFRLHFRVDTALNDDVAAWEHLSLANQWKDSIYNQEKQRQWAMMQGEYETESAQRLIDVLEKENEVKELRIKQSRIYFFVLVGFLLILVFMGLLFFRQRKMKTLVNEQKLQHELEINKIESKKLKELDELKSRFFANISHEFRTPLTLILGPLEKLLSKAKDQQDKNEINVAKKYAGKLQKLINNLLTISKLESGKMQLLASETDIVKLVNNYFQAFESLAKQKNIELIFASEKKEIEAFIDREKFEQVLNNLLSNAFKFTTEGGRIEIAVGSPQSAVHSQQSTAINKNNEDWRLETGDIPGPGVEIIISDTGCGIAPEHREHIFDRFYQVAQEDQSYHEGTGIGLALTKELVELHYGTIKVESEPGIGSTFTIILPLGKDHLNPEELCQHPASSIENPASSIEQLSSAEASASNAGDQSAFAKATADQATQPILLIVEDNTDMRVYIREYFETDYYIIEAVDGVEGYEKSTENVPDIIISDVMMPKMNGNEFCRRVKTDERTSHIPVVLLTARASAEYKIEGLETGADDYISKPFDPNVLKVRVKNLIEQRQKLREKFIADFWKGDQSPAIQIPVSDLNQMDRKFLQKALDVVGRQLSEPDFDINQFSREMAMSRQQLHRKIRALVNQSATEFIRTIRLKKSAELLSQKTGTISEIAYDVGFNSLTYFTRSFQKYYGMTPSEFIENNSKA